MSHWETRFWSLFEHHGRSARSAMSGEIHRFPPSLGSPGHWTIQPTSAPVVLPAKASRALTKELRRSWFGMLRMLHIVRTARLTDGYVTEENEEADSGPSYSGATAPRLRQLEGESHSRASAGSWDSSTPPVKTAGYYRLRLGLH